MADPRRPMPGAPAKRIGLFGGDYRRWMQQQGLPALKAAGNQVRAGVNGFGDAVTVGLGDPYVAARLALEGWTPGKTLTDRYHVLREAQRAEDRYDQQHYRIARGVGQAGGTVAGVALTGGLGEAAVGARLAPQAARLTGLRQIPRVFGPPVVAAGVGAAASVAGQGVADSLSRRVSSPHTYASAALGGAAGGAATLFRGPKAGAIVDAAVTEGAHAALSGRPVSLENIQRDALGGVYLGQLGQTVGTNWAQGLTNKQKENLGERLSRLKSRTHGDQWMRGQVDLEVPGGHTRADQLTKGGVHIEAKFGTKAKFSKRQLEALAMYNPDRWRPDHWLPRDIGRGVGGILGSWGGQAFAEDEW